MTLQSDFAGILGKQIHRNVPSRRIPERFGQDPSFRTGHVKCKFGIKLKAVALVAVPDSLAAMGTAKTTQC